MTSTNFPDGVTNVLEYKAFGQCVIPSPSRVHTFLEDFNTYIASATQWVETVVGTDTTGVIDGAGGILSIANDTNDNDHVYAQWVAEICAFVAGKQSWFATRFQIDVATESDLFIGLYVTDTDPIGAITDGVYLHKADGSTTLNLVVVNGSTATTTAITTVAADTWYVVGLHYNGSDKIDIYLNDDRVASSVTTNLPPDDLKPSFAVQNGDAAAVTALIDYIFWVTER